MPIRATVITWKTYSVVEWDSEVFVQEVKMPWERSLTGTFCRSLFTLYVLGAVEFPKLKLISLGTVFRRQSYTLWQTDWSTSGCCWRPEVKLTIEMKRITTLCSTYSSSRSDWVKRWSFCWYFWMQCMPNTHCLCCHNPSIFIARQHTDARYCLIANLSVCPSVRLSVTFRYQMKTA